MWLSFKFTLFNPIQIHITANPQFVEGTTDPYSNRSGMFEAGHQITTVAVPDDIESTAVSLRAISMPRSKSKSGSLDPV